MTEWKPKAGEDAVVRVRELLDDGRLASLESSSGVLFTSALRPLPSALSAEDALRDPSDADVASAYSAWRNHPGSNPEAVGCAIADFLARRRSTPPAAVAQDSAWVPKVGDRVRVKNDPKWLQHGKSGTVRRTTDAGRENWVAYVAIDRLDAPPVCYDFSGLEPDPEPATPRDTTALERAVVEAAKAWQAQDPETEDSWVCMQRAEDLANAVRALLAAEAPMDPTPKESMAETLWPFIKHGMRGCERLEWAKVNRGSAAWDMAMHAAEAALSALGDRGRG